MKRWRVIFGRTGLLLIEGLAVLGVVLALVVGFATWRLQNGPVDLDFAKDYIAEILHDEASGISVNLDEAALYWPELSGPVFIGIKNLELKDRAGRKFFEIGEVAVGLSRSRLLIGKIAPTALIIKKPGLRITRHADNRLDFGFASSLAGRGQTKEADDLLDTLLQYVAHPGDEGAGANRFYRLRALDIEDATIMVEDHVLGISWFGQGFNLSTKSGRSGLEAHFTFSLPSTPSHISDIEASATYDWESRALSFIVDFQDFNLQFLGSRLPALGLLSQTSLPLNGHITGLFTKDAGLQTLEARLGAQEGKMRIPAIRPVPLDYKDLQLDLAYDRTAQSLSLSRVALELEGIPLNAQGAFRFTLPDKGFPDRLEGSFEAGIPALDHSKIVSLWPEILREDSSREWIVDKIKSGKYADLKAAATVVLEYKDGVWESDIPAMNASFAFQDAEVDYRAPLSVLKEGKGTGVFDLARDNLLIKIDSGRIDDMTLNGAELLFTEVIAVGKGNLILKTKVAGPLKTALSYAGKEPISLTDSLDFDVGKVKGDATLDIMLDFPTSKDVKLSEFKIDIKGSVDKIFIPAAVGKADLTGGPLSISADQETALIDGKALLGGRPMILRREGFLRSEGKPYKNKTTATISTDNGLRQALGIDVSEFLDGAATVTLTQTEQAGGKAEADISVDLSPAAFFIRPLGYEKPARAKGSAKMKAALQDGKLKEIKNLTIDAEGLTLPPAHITFTQTDGETLLSTAVINGLAVRETQIDLEMQRRKTGQMQLVIAGPFLDARPFLNDDRKAGPDEPRTPMIVSVAVDKMHTADDQTVQAAKIYADINAQGAFDQFEVDAQAGAGQVYLRFKPDDTGRRGFLFEADDAGAALKAFGVYDKIAGGTIKVTADPIGDPQSRNLAGKATLNNFKVVKAPALARLLGALSVPGLLELLGNDGLVFSKLESDFTWTYKPGGSTLTLKEGRTSGNSLGLTFDGTIERGTDMMDIKGTIIPLSTMNKIVGSIPLLGDLITGGTGSVFAATYTMRGETEDPDVMVNPLSVLTPGILRRILFE